MVFSESLDHAELRKSSMYLLYPWVWYVYEITHRAQIGQLDKEVLN